MSIYAGRDNDGKIVVDIDQPASSLLVPSRPTVLDVMEATSRWRITPAEAEKLAHDLLALAYDHEANRAAYGDASDTEDHDRAVDQQRLDEEAG